MILCETTSRVSETLRVTAYRKGSVLSFSVMFWKSEGRAFSSCGRSRMRCRMFSVTLPDICEISPTLGRPGSSRNRLNLVATRSKTSTSDSWKWSLSFEALHLKPLPLIIPLYPFEAANWEHHLQA